MATYAIGDVQGCYESLRVLLEVLDFDPAHDQAWFVGDLVNRGPMSLETLRFVKSLGSSAHTVLGNHDLHLLAIVFGGHSATTSDTFDDVLEASDCEELAQWLRGLPILHQDRGWVMTHAGMPHIWSVETACALAREVEAGIRGAEYRSYFAQMYGNEPAAWSETVEGMDRLRVITNYFTRMRLIAEDGTLDFTHKGSLDETAPEGFRPWFEFEPRFSTRAVFGHWAALDGETGSDQLHGVDTGCVWGRSLTALRLEDARRFSVEAAE